MLNDNLVKQELQKLINEELINKKITNIRIKKGDYFIILTGNMRTIIKKEWLEDYLNRQDVKMKEQIIYSLKNAGRSWYPANPWTIEKYKVRAIKHKERTLRKQTRKRSDYEDFISKDYDVIK